MNGGQYREVAGVAAFVEVLGEGPPVLCLHTAGQSGVQWRDAARALAACGWTAVVPDLPGHGRSEPAAGGPVRDLGEYGAWCAALMGELAPLLGRFRVAGCSIGGKIALDLACRMGADLDGVVAMAADAGMPAGEGQAFARSMERELEDAAAPSRSDRTYLGTLAVVGRGVPEARRRLIATMHRREDPEVTLNDLVGWARFDRWAALPQVACPVQLAVGEDDLWMVPERVARTAEAIPGARWTLLDGIGHYPMEEMDGIGTVLDGWFRAMEVR